MRRCAALLLCVAALAGCGGGGESSAPDKDAKDTPDTKNTKESSSNNPMDHIKGNVDWSIETKKSIRDEGKARADEADKIINQRLKGGK